jgi:hypothetical protein
MSTLAKSGLALFVACAALLPTPASALLLGSYTHTLQGLTSDPATTARVCLGWDLIPSCSSNPSKLLTPFFTTAQGAGTLVTFDATTNPNNFALVAAYLTDGTDQILKTVLQTTVNDIIYAPHESQVFAGSLSLNGIDFAGYTIDSVTVLLGPDFHVTPVPATGGSDVGATLTVSIYGHTVPEPRLSLLAAGGALALWLRRRVTSI